MDIHPPHSPIRSLRDFAIQLITITAGVLIALSLEGLRETYREHVLVSEAHEMLAREIADNRKDVENVLGSLHDQRQNLVVALRFADDLLARKHTDVRELSLKLDFAELSNASWTGAERTGALGHMSYADVRKYAQVFAQQEIFTAHQRQMMQRLTAAVAILGAGGGDPTQAGAKDLEAFRSEVLGLLGALALEEDFGKHLSETYRASLEK